MRVIDKIACMRYGNNIVIIMKKINGWVFFNPLTTGYTFTVPALHRCAFPNGSYIF